MKLVPTSQISPLINRCYLDYDPEWPASLPKQRVHSFKYHIEHTAGLKLDFIPALKDGRYGYELNQVEVVDDKKYMMFLLRWS